MGGKKEGEAREGSKSTQEEETMETVCSSGR